MIKNVNILNPILVEFDSISTLYFVDPLSFKVYDLKGESASEEDSKLIFENLYGQQKKLMPVIPKDDIKEVLQTEKNIEEENINHVFRKGTDARS